MAFPLFVQEIDKQGVARITLTRTEVHNAFNEALIAELTAALEGVGQDRRVRVVVLAAQGPSFSAGTDLNWMKAMAGYSQAENLEDRSEEHTSELQSLMRISYAVFCLKKKKKKQRAHIYQNEQQI